MPTDVQVAKKSYRNDESYQPNHLHLQISGKEINYVIINTLRRVILSNIPCYAFNRENIKINENTSIYNNNRMKERISFFPIRGVKHKLDLEEYDRLRVYTRGKKSYTDEEVDDTKDNMNNISVLNIYLKVKNDGDDILDVTTDDCEYYDNGKKIKSIYTHVAKICELKKGEKLEFSAIVDKGIPLNHARYCCTSICCYDQKKENDFLFKLESTAQFNEKEILIRATKILLHILEKNQKELVGTKFSKNKHGKITLEDYDHTIGNLLSKELQDNPNIKFAAYKMDHLLIRNVTIEYITDGKKTINEILDVSFKKLIKLHTKLLDKFNSLKL